MRSHQSANPFYLKYPQKSIAKRQKVTRSIIPIICPRIIDPACSR